MNAKTKEAFYDIKEKLQDANESRNIANSERLLSVATGAFVFYTGIVGMFRHPLSSLAEVAIGSALLLRGATGYCPVKEAMDPGRDVTVIEHRIVEE